MDLQATLAIIPKKKPENSCKAAIGLVNYQSSIKFLAEVYPHTEARIPRKEFTRGRVPAQVERQPHKENHMPKTAIFEIEREGETIISTPLANLSSFDDVESNAGEVVDALSDLSIKNLVLDFRKTDYFGCSALALFVKLRRIVKGHNGSMAFCRLSEHESEILHVTRLERLWPICRSREQAMKAVGS